MHHECGITQRLLRRQKTMFRIAALDGWSQTLIAQRAGLSPSSVGEYARGATTISGPSFMKLAEVLPDELLSLLIPSGKHIVSAPDELDHDALGDLARDYVDAKVKAHRADSPMGPEIAPCEDAALRSKVTQLRAA